MVRPPLNAPILAALMVAADLEAATAPRGVRMLAAERLQKELWRQRHAIVDLASRDLPPARSAAVSVDDRDQLEMFG